ncbi:MAG: anthranilate phosphoribosyltransferase [Gammaproteobacteria bacterium]
MSTRPAEFLERLLAHDHLRESEAASLLELLTEEDLSPAVAGALLTALRAKGETPEEVRGFAAAMRGLARKPALPDREGLVDIVGTGGDASGSLNLSTGTALLAAACGIPVAKHGNRSVSSKSGSADVLESLGMELPLDEARAADCLAQTRFTFLFAPYYHPAMKAVAPVRKAMGVRTVFNILGPLTNPAAPPYLLLGAYSPEMAALMADALAGAEDLRRAFVIHGEPGWDEATPVGTFLLYDVRGGRVEEQVRDPADLGIPRCAPDALAGGSCDYNAGRIRDVFEGREAGAHADALVLGAALALELTGRADSTAEGAAMARDVLNRGDAAETLQRLAGFFGRPEAGG